MKATTGKSFVYLSLSIGFILPLCFAVTASAQMPPTNRLETGGNYQIGPPPSNMMFQITDNPTNAGDDNLVWSNSGRMLAVDRSDPNVSLGALGNKYICLLDVRNLGNVQVLGARSSAVTNPLFANITGWTWNDDRVLFGWQPQAGTPPAPDKVRLMSCTSGTGAMSVVNFLMSDPQGNPTNHVYSPSVVLDPSINEERLLFLVSSSTNNNQNGPTDVTTQPAARINLYTVPFNSGGVPNWNDRVQLTAFNTNLSIASAKWCPELGTNYQPICNRLVMLVVLPAAPPAMENNRLIVLNNVQGIIANPSTAPTNLLDPRFVVVETNLTMNSQVSWTYDGQYVMYGRTGTNPPPAPPSSDIYSMRANSATNTAVKFEVPGSISGGQKQWLAISPDGMKAAFTVDHHVYVIPLQFDNIAVTGAVVTNVLTDASYTAVDVSGDAIPSNTVFSIVAPPSVDTNNFNGEFSGFAREFSVSGVSSQFNLETNALMTLHFSQSDIPSGASATNLAIYVYNPQATNDGGPTGTWTKLDSVINTNDQTIAAEVQHFSIYSIGRASAQAESNQPPSAPTGLSASKGTHINKVRVTWDSVSNATSYEVWCNTVNVSSSATKFDTEPTTNRFDDTSACVGHVYYYWVKAKNSAGTSGFSSSDSGYIIAPVTGDIDGDGLADLISVVGTSWYVWFSTAQYLVRGGPYTFNVSGAPVTGDIDGDRLADMIVVEDSSWYVWFSTAQYLVRGGPYNLSISCEHTTGDIDGDGLADLISVVGTSWYVWFSTAQYLVRGGPYDLGLSGTPTTGDIDGDGLADLIVVVDSDWYVWFSTAQYLVRGGPYALGISGLPATGDIDGDGLADLISVVGTDWYVWFSTAQYLVRGGPYTLNLP